MGGLKLIRRSNSQKSQHRWKIKVFVMMLLGSFFGTLLIMETQYSRIRMLALLSTPKIQNPKIAFLFIARNRLPLDIVWDAFFQVIRLVLCGNWIFPVLLRFCFLSFCLKYLYVCIVSLSVNS